MSSLFVERLLGYQPSEMIGYTVTASFSSPRRPCRSGRKVCQLVLNNQTDPGEFRFSRKSGGYCWMRTSGRPIVRGELVVGISGIASDITEQKRAEKSLRESEQRFRALFENSPISLWEEDFSAGTTIHRKIESKRRIRFSKIL